MAHNLIQRLLAEFIGTAGIVATVTGAGHMATSLGADSTVGLMMIAFAVGAVLFGAITMLGPISGAHFNPAVTIVMGLKKRISATEGSIYISVQILGGIGGAIIANLMFDKSWVSANTTVRAVSGGLLGEVVATYGLVLLILLLAHHNLGSLIGAGVGTWIIAGHFFTSSTSFANPAVTIGRAFTDAITGIELASVAPFIGMQLVGALLALGTFTVLTKNK